MFSIIPAPITAQKSNPQIILTNKTMSNEIELYSKLQNPIEAIDKIGAMFARSNMFGCDRIEQGQVLAMACLTEKKSPIQLNREYHIIEGKLADRADSMLAKFRGRGGKHKVLSRTPDEASVELELAAEKQIFRLSFKDVCEEPFPWSNKQDANGNRLLKKNWATPRARMQTLWARVISDGVRTMAPEIVCGAYTPEEIEDSSETIPAPLLRPQQPPIEVVAEPVTIIHTHAPAPHPEPKETQSTSTPEPRKFLPSDVATDPATGKLTLETVMAIDALIPADIKSIAHEWLVNRGWIVNSLEDLNQNRAMNIIEKPAGFLKIVKGEK